jgi:3-oxosteroid 1-dehydrogenase
VPSTRSSKTTQVDRRPSEGTTVQTVDVVVVGSGAAGLTAALTAALQGCSVTVIESTQYYGGTTAYSGGAIWIPCNPLMAAAGIADDLDDARMYMTSLAGDSVTDASREAYLRTGQEMVREFNKNTTWVRWRLLDYPDYRSEKPGSRRGGRSIEAEIIDGHELGPDLKNLRPLSPAMDLGPAAMTATDFVALNMYMRTWRGKKAIGRIAGRTVWSLLCRRKLLAIGQALVARLRLALRDMGVPILLRTRLTSLLTEGANVVGVWVTDPDGSSREIRARRGVILAAGGFSRNQQWRDKYLPSPSKVEWAMVPTEGQDGEAIAAGQAVGAHTALMHRAWGMPACVVKLGGSDAVLLGHIERSVPGAIVIDDDGHRYADETLPYEDFWKQMYEAGGGPSWLVFDQRAKNRYVMLRTPPPIPFPRAWLREGYVRRGSTLGALAKTMGVPEPTLMDTVASYNRAAADGKDTEFGRGETTFARFFGDPTLPHPNLAPLEHPPYYAVRLQPGELSTKGGLAVDEHGRVLDDDGPIPGLYAAGNTAAAPGVGDSYPGAGGTIGAAMVFGYLAGKHAAQFGALQQPDLTSR